MPPKKKTPKGGVRSPKAKSPGPAQRATATTTNDSYTALSDVNATVEAESAGPQLPYARAILLVTFLLAAAIALALVAQNTRATPAFNSTSINSSSSSSSSSSATAPYPDFSSSSASSSAFTFSTFSSFSSSSSSSAPSPSSAAAPNVSTLAANGIQHSQPSHPDVGLSNAAMRAAPAFLLPAVLPLLAALAAWFGRE